MAEATLLLPNGVDGSTGDYIYPNLDLEAASEYIQQGEPEDDLLLGWLQKQARAAATLTRDFPPDLDQKKASQAGWGILYAPDLDAPTKEALQRLVQYRREQADDPRTVKEFTYDGESWAYKWLNNQGVSTGVYDPYRVPYYLLLAGSPQSIPFAFGFQLNVNYAVGRLHFDTAEAYARYIDSLIGYEKAASVANRREIVYFAPNHDGSTAVSTSQLVAPLVSGVAETAERPAVMPVAQACRFASRPYLGGNASKNNLRTIVAPVTQAAAPALLFTASHGVGVKQSEADQPEVNGALLCQNWSGPGAINPDDYFAAHDLPADARLGGMISLHFACFGGGTPERDRYARMVRDLPDYSAKTPFIAALPRHMLAHPNGGALACLAHIDRIFTTSIDTTRRGPRYQPYRNLLYSLMRGVPVGYLNQHEFSRQAADLASILNERIEYGKIGGRVKGQELVPLWIERNDASSFLVLGDPAARLRVDDLAPAG
jgi:hypothetical protein